jgi:hydroxymethylpyrimidine pyrophosphatase-like HAD family hydrolase
MEKEFSDLEIIKHGKYSLEITNKNVTKWNALKNVCQNYKVLENEIACIGDSNNDLECIKNCGFSFSITKKNKEIIENSDINFKKQKNAVAKAINNYLLKI